VLFRFRVAPVCIGRWFVTVVSIRPGVVGGFHLSDGAEVKVVTGIDDNSRFVVSAMVVARATAHPVCDALLGALHRYGVPEQVLTLSSNSQRITAAR
jgi:hypothetical protein